MQTDPTKSKLAFLMDLDDNIICVNVGGGGDHRGPH